MPLIKLDPAKCAVLVIDVQVKLVPSLFESDRLLRRISFLLQVANLLGVPILCTEQNPSRLGPTDPSISARLGETPLAKMEFSAGPVLDGRLEAEQVVVVGAETHICIQQTAQDLLSLGHEVVVCPDGVSSSTQERHKLGMERIRDAGIVPAHTESVAYEWIRSAEHPQFRDFLEIVKRSAI